MKTVCYSERRLKKFVTPDPLATVFQAGLRCIILPAQSIAQTAGEI